MSEPEKPIILYDGVCGLCDRLVQFVIKHDSAGRVKFAALQSEFGKRMLRKLGLDENVVSFVVLLEGGTYYTKSVAVLRTLRHLDGVWKIASCLRIIPPAISNVVYDVVARHRYSWFGKFDACPIPDKSTRQRFIE